MKKLVAASVLLPLAVITGAGTASALDTTPSPAEQQIVTDAPAELNTGQPEVAGTESEVVIVPIETGDSADADDSIATPDSIVTGDSGETLREFTPLEYLIAYDLELDDSELRADPPVEMEALMRGLQEGKYPNLEQRLQGGKHPEARQEMKDHPALESDPRLAEYIDTLEGHRGTQTDPEDNSGTSIVPGVDGGTQTDPETSTERGVDGQTQTDLQPVPNPNTGGGMFGFLGALLADAFHLFTFGLFR